MNHPQSPDSSRRQRKQTHQNPGRRRRSFFEHLEDRRLLAAVTSTEGWSVLDQIPASRSSAPAYIQPTKFTSLALNRDSLASKLATAPAEFGGGTSGAIVMSLPAPDGSFSRFYVQESSIMEPALAAQFPDIKTYVGQGLDDPSATLRADLTPAGFHAQVLSPYGTYYVDPYYHLEDDFYISYFKQDLLARPDSRPAEHVDAAAHEELLRDLKVAARALACLKEQRPRERARSCGPTV